MAYTTVFNPWTKKLDYVGGTVDSTAGGAASVWELEAVVSAWLMEDGTSFWLTEA